MSHRHLGTGKRNHLSVSNHFRTLLLLVETELSLMAKQTAMEFPLLSDSPNLRLPESEERGLGDRLRDNSGGSPQRTVQTRQKNLPGVTQGSSVAVIPMLLAYLDRTGHENRAEVENLPDGDCYTLWPRFALLSLVRQGIIIKICSTIISVFILQARKSLTRTRESAGYLLSCRLGESA